MGTINQVSKLYRNDRPTASHLTRCPPQRLPFETCHVRVKCLEDGGEGEGGRIHDGVVTRLEEVQESPHPIERLDRKPHLPTSSSSARNMIASFTTNFFSLYSEFVL